MQYMCFNAKSVLSSVWQDEMIFEIFTFEVSEVPNNAKALNGENDQYNLLTKEKETIIGLNLIL